MFLKWLAHSSYLIMQCTTYLLRCSYLKESYYYCYCYCYCYYYYYCCCCYYYYYYYYYY